jgi:hypothetical protein
MYDVHFVKTHSRTTFSSIDYTVSILSSIIFRYFQGFKIILEKNVSTKITVYLTNKYLYFPMFLIVIPIVKTKNVLCLHCEIGPHFHIELFYVMISIFFSNCHYVLFHITYYYSILLFRAIIVSIRLRGYDYENDRQT